VALSQIDMSAPISASPNIDSFMGVVFGGVAISGVRLVAAMSLGVANKLLEPVAAPYSARS